MREFVCATECEECLCNEWEEENNRSKRSRKLKINDERRANVRPANACFVCRLFLLQNLLQRESSSGRSDEGAAGRNDWTVAPSDTRLVPEQKMQRQKENDSNEAPDAAGEG